MVSFWPSLGLLLFFLAAFLKCRAIGARVTLPLGGFLPFFAYGAVGATLLSLLLEQMPLFQFPLVENSHLQLVAPAAWLSGPAIEELAKALPIFVLAFAGTTSRRLTVADLTLAGFATGAGFGFVEANLQVLAGGAFPGFNWLSTDFDAVEQFGSNYSICFAGHAVNTGLIALVAAASVRLLPLDRVYTWIPAAVAFLLVFFDHTMFNWKMLHPGLAIGGNFIEAPNTLESLYVLTFHGRLETWLLPVGLIAAQIAEAWFCTNATGKRHDLLLPGEWRGWVVSEWLVLLQRLRLGRAAVQHTLVYFRRRRAFALTKLEAKRNPDDRALASHVRFLERRLDREREFLVSPPAGTWLLPRSVWLDGGTDYAWRSRWVFAFAALFIALFMFGPHQLPELLRDDTTTSVLVALAVGFTAWQGYRFWGAAQPDAVVGESTAQAMYQARMFLLGASVVGALCPALALLVGWKALVPGAAYISSYFSLWIAQGGSPYALMALASIGGAIDTDPAPTGQILRDEMAAASERIRRLERNVAERAATVLASIDPSMVQEPAGGARGIAGMMWRVLHHDGGSGPTLVLTGILGSRSSAAPAHATPLDRTLGEFVDLMAKLDADRDAQERRKLLLDEFERQAAETRGDDLSLAIQSVQQEFEGLAAGLQMAASKELARMAAFEQAYSKAWVQAMRELDAYDGIRRAVKEPLRLFWEPAKDDVWAARVAAITDERALPLQAILLPELEAFVAEATTEDAETLKAAIERIRAAQFDALEQPEESAGEPQAAEDWQPAESESGSQQDEIAADVAEDTGIQPAAEVVTEDDALALENFGEESQRIGTVEETDEAPVQSEATDGAAEFDQHEAPVEHPEEDLVPAAAEIPAAIPPDTADERDELQRLLDTIKRDSGYLATVKISETPAPVTEEIPPEPAVEVAERSEPELEQLRDTIRRESGYMERPADDADIRDLTIPYEEAVEIAEAAAAVDAVLLEQPADDFVAATATDHIDAAEDQLPSIDSLDISASEAAEAPTEPIQISEDADFPLPPELALQESVEPETELAQEPAEQEPVQLEVEAVDTQAISPEIVAIEEAQSPAAEIAEEPQQQITEPDAGSSEHTSAAVSDGDAVASAAIADNANAEAPQEDVPPEPAAQVETTSIETSPIVAFHMKGRSNAAMLDGYSMVAKATVQSAPVEELPVEDPIELAADNIEGEPQVDFEVLPDTNEHALFEESQIQVDSASVETVSTAGDGWSAEAAVAATEGTDGGIVPIVEAPQDAESHIDRSAAERESPILETPKGADLADFVEAQLAKLGDRAPIKEAAPVGEEPKPEPSVDPDPAPAAIPDPWDVEAGTLFALESIPEANEPMEFAPAAIDELRAAANAAEQMPLDFTAPKQRDTNPVAVDDASLPVEAVAQSADSESTPEPAPEPAAAEASPVEDVRPEPEIPAEKPAQTSLRAVVDGAKESKDGAGLLHRVGGFFRASREKKSRNQPADLRSVINQPVAPKPETVEFVAPEETTRNEAIVAEPVAAAEEAIVPTTPAVADAIAPVQREDIVATDAQKMEPVRDAIPSSLDSVESFDELETGAVRPRTDMEDASADDDYAVPAVEQILPSEEIKEQPTQPVQAVADSAPSPERADAKSVARDAALGTLVEQLLAHIQKAGATAPAEAAVAQQGAQASSLPDLVEQLRTQVQKLGARPHDQAAEASQPNADPKQAREDALANLVEQLRSEVQKSRETPVEAASLPAQEPSEAKAPLVEISLPKLEDFLRAHLESTDAPVRPAAPLPKPRAPSPPTVDVPAREQKPVENAAPAGKPARSARNASKARAKPVNEKKLPVFENTPKPEKHAPEQKTIAPPPATAKPEKDVPPQKAAAPARAAETPVRLVRDIGPRGATRVEPEKKPLTRELEGSNSGGMRPSKFFNPGQVRPDVEDVTPLRKAAVEKRGTESRLSEAVGAYYAELKLPLPPMHTTDIAGIRKIIDSGRLETPRKGPAPWSFSGVLRKGDVAIRVKAGSEKYIEFVASNETFGQVGRFYPRSVGLGAFKTFIPAEHLEYFDLTSLEWKPVKQ